MPIPDYQSIFKPLLKLAGDEKEHSVKEAHDKLAEEFGLTEDEINVLVPSGKVRLFYDRLAWAKTYLKKAGLLEDIRRGVFKITKRGLEVFKEDPPNLNAKYLKKFPEFLEFHSGKPISGVDTGTEPPPEDDDGQTPEEQLDQSYQKIKSALASDLLDQVKSCAPQFFEQLVVDLMVAMGYGGSRVDAGKAVGRVKDGGIDGIIKEDKLGLDVVYLQAKRWKDSVGRPTVQAFAGSLEGHRANKGVIITTSTFSKDAHEYVTNIGKKIVLIDGKRLSEFMIDYDLGVSKVISYEIKKIDGDYFIEE